jgi:hypothetical protein
MMTLAALIIAITLRQLPTKQQTMELSIANTVNMREIVQSERLLPNRSMFASPSRCYQLNGNRRDDLILRAGRVRSVSFELLPTVHDTHMCDIVSLGPNGCVYHNRKYDYGWMELENAQFRQDRRAIHFESRCCDESAFYIRFYHTTTSEACHCPFFLFIDVTCVDHTKNTKVFCLKL